MKLLAYDTETGGLSARKHSLLTLYCGVYFQDSNKKFTLINELDLKIKPNEGESYQITAGALAINKIDLVKHDRESLTINQAAEKLYYFLKSESDDGKIKLTPGGHNEPFDKGFILENLLREEIWRNFVDYHSLDTVPIARALKMSGKLPKDLKLNLKSLAAHLGHSIPAKDLHVAKNDTHLFVKTLESLIAMM